MFKGEVTCRDVEEAGVFPAELQSRKSDTVPSMILTQVSQSSMRYAYPQAYISKEENLLLVASLQNTT
jgi:hypothetical protein